MRVCREFSRWVTETIENPFETWIEQTERFCTEQPCNWWCLCCNVWLCLLFTVIVRVITLLLIIIVHFITDVLCEIVGFLLDLGAFFVNLIQSIPILGGIIRAVLNWGREVTLRLAGIIDFLLSLAGVQVEKKMYVKLVIFNNSGVPLTNEATVLPSIQQAQNIFRTQCNVNMIYTGVCVPQLATPPEALTVSCDASGFFGDWWVAGSYIELVTADCGFKDGFRRLLGYGGEIFVCIVANVTPDTPTFSTNGCSHGPTHDYLVVEASNLNGIAHEIAHCCGLWHVNDGANLMNPTWSPSTTALYTWQKAWFRNSRHVTLV